MTADSATQGVPHPDDRGTATCRIEARAGGEVAWITVAHEGKMNAMGTGMMNVLIRIFADLEARADLRVAILTGAGTRAFVGGAFVPEMHALDVQSSRVFIDRLHHVLLAVRQCPVPVIARVSGYCLGAGTDLAAACDFRVADKSAVFGMPEVRVGMPAVIEAALLPMLIGWGRTREMLMTGANYSAAQGREMGFFETVCEADAIDAVIEEKIRHIFAGGPLAVRAQKRLINAWEERFPADAIRLGLDYMERAIETGEPQRMMAPLLKRS
ncbi:MAG: enoyl-CoA hydratase-related protein [Burkholderiales bacterium]